MRRLGTASTMIATSRQAEISLGITMAGTVYSGQLIYHKAELSWEGLSGGIAGRLAVSLSFFKFLRKSRQAPCNFQGILELFFCEMQDG
jgi:hypothetical protein